MKNKIIYFSALLLLISAIVIVSCGKSNSYGSSSSNNPVPVANSVSIVNMAFSPVTLTVTAGSTITWTNNDNMTHTVTADDNSFDSGNIAMGSKYSKTFSTAGTYTYHCTIHPNMKGTIIVK